MPFPAEIQGERIRFLIAHGLAASFAGFIAFLLQLFTVHLIFYNSLQFNKYFTTLYSSVNPPVVLDLEFRMARGTQKKAPIP